LLKLLQLNKKTVGTYLNMERKKRLHVLEVILGQIRIGQRRHPQIDKGMMQWSSAKTAGFIAHGVNNAMYSFICASVKGRKEFGSSRYPWYQHIVQARVCSMVKRECQPSLARAFAQSSFR